MISTESSEESSTIPSRVTIHSCETLTWSSDKTLGKSGIRITPDMVHNLQYDIQLDNDGYETWQATTPYQSLSSILHVSVTAKSPQLMALFADGDINSAMRILLESLHAPFGPNAVATILVERSIADDVKARIQLGMHCLLGDSAYNNHYMRTVDKLQLVDFETIMGDPEKVQASVTPIVVIGHTQNELGTWPSGVITMHTFGCLAEAIAAYRSEEMFFEAVSIWNETMDGVHELLAAISSTLLYINCCNVDIEPIRDAYESSKKTVLVWKGLHYKIVELMGKRKIIVFPVGKDIKKLIQLVDKAPKKRYIDGLNP
ncbi:uncharacterized protein LOC115625501 [Scaptodrosophila lebanonensis]|uniref:Uncharacterized protein LOC115625501 n=1 Tax=Drosophila lebanonensis TaxID=7225 RepID=A0A6J2TIB2_DROLE|nr:uncharacterized protein LOC115625501 [Scaptodrosophila lebanonensis]